MTDTSAKSLQQIHIQIHICVHIFYISTPMKLRLCYTKTVHMLSKFCIKIKCLHNQHIHLWILVTLSTEIEKWKMSEWPSPNKTWIIQVIQRHFLLGMKAVTMGTVYDVSLLAYKLCYYKNCQCFFILLSIIYDDLYRNCCLFLNSRLQQFTPENTLYVV